MVKRISDTKTHFYSGYHYRRLVFSAIKRVQFLYKDLSPENISIVPWPILKVGSMFSISCSMP